MTGHLWSDRRHPLFWGTRPTIFSKLDFKDRRTWNDQRHESWLSDTVELQHCHTTLTWVALLVTTWRCSDSFLRYVYIYNMCIIYTYLFILFPQMYRLLSNFICIGIRLPHQTPIYVHHATCSVTFPETNQTHLQMGRNPKLIWTNHPFSDAKMLGFRESTFLFSELTD